MVHMSDDEFEELVEQALDDMPEQFVQDMENVAVVIADEPTEAGNPAGTRYGGEILGLYSGVPLTERYYGDFEGGYPDVITIFKGPHERCFATRDQIAEEVRKTVIHEIGHYFGLDDARLHEMGY